MGVVPRETAGSSACGSPEMGDTPGSAGRRDRPGGNPVALVAVELGVPGGFMVEPRLMVGDMSGVPFTFTELLPVSEPPIVAEPVPIGAELPLIVLVPLVVELGAVFLPGAVPVAVVPVPSPVAPVAVELLAPAEVPALAEPELAPVPAAPPALCAEASGVPRAVVRLTRMRKFFVFMAVDGFAVPPSVSTWSAFAATATAARPPTRQTDAKGICA